jgi:hypothetical protein
VGLKRFTRLVVAPFARCTKALQDRRRHYALSKAQGFVIGCFGLSLLTVIMWLLGMRIGDLGEAGFVLLMALPCVLLILGSGFLLGSAVAQLPKTARASRGDWIIFWTTYLAMPLLCLVTVIGLKT